jgi:hypothetical protein
MLLPAWPAWATAPLVGGTFAAVYLGGAVLLGLPDVEPWLARLRQ